MKTTPAPLHPSQIPNSKPSSSSGHKSKSPTPPNHSAPVMNNINSTSPSPHDEPTPISNGPTTLAAPSMQSLHLTDHELATLLPTIRTHHRYPLTASKCSSLLSQRVFAPARAVWSIVRRFDRPHAYKHFIRSCSIQNPSDPITPGCLRDVSVISGLPASTSTERLDILDDDRMITGFTIIGGEHRLRNYKSITTVDEFVGDAGEVWSVVLESYVVDVPEGNTIDDTRLFADTVVRLNLQKLADVAERSVAAEGGKPIGVVKPSLVHLARSASTI